MGFDDLLQQLHEHVETQLIFDFGDRKLEGAFHVTEIKVADVRSVDCGSGRSGWTEIVIQLLETGRKDPAMKAGKFVSILSAAGADLPSDASVLFEYAPEKTALIRFQATSLNKDNGTASVRLTPEKTQCKALDRAVNGVRSARSCC